MMRNDYRRALILLRGNAAGYSGHVRLERRTLMGSMYFLIQAPEQCGTLRAALVGRGKDSYYACALGELQRDARGQAVLSYSFDPRSICERELEQYQLIVITCAEDADCAILLWGNVCGHAQLNWERVRTAVCGLYAPPVARVEEAALQESAERLILEEPCCGEASEKKSEGEETAPAEEMHQEEAPGTAGELLGIDMNLPWPADIEPVRALFQISVPMENPPDQEYTYIAAAMPPESGYAYSAVGVRVQDGAPVSVRYGLPAPWSAAPPAGLEDYSWLGDQNRGFWMIQIDFPVDK